MSTSAQRTRSRCSQRKSEWEDGAAIFSECNMGRAMDEIVLRSMAKWPNVPDVYGWLSLDRRGNWLIKNERIGNLAFREFIGRNYQPDARGCWYFQNGPQRVFVKL